MHRVNVGLAGFGTVGSGTYGVSTRNAELIAQRAGVELAVTRVVCRNVEAARSAVGPEVQISEDWHDIVNDPTIGIAVELMGGIEPARSYVMACIEAGKHVVTANKALLAAHGNEIFAAAQAKGVHVGFEASVAGGIPIIKVLRQGLVANRIEWLAGIINGTCNFILSKMRDEGVAFDETLALAQKLGYAEADPTFDIEGYDAAHKLTILASLAFGVPIDTSATYVEGITKLDSVDIVWAEELGYRLKLLGIARRTDAGIETRVHPTLVPSSALLANVEGVMNAVVVNGDALGTSLYYGRGAGSDPTASAVVADLTEVAQRMTCGCVDNPNFANTQTARLPMAETVSQYYIRLVLDNVDAIDAIKARFAAAGVNLQAVHQRPADDASVAIVVMTDTARECDVQAVLKAIADQARVAAVLRREDFS